MRRERRQKYERPRMRVVEMRVKNQLLAGSGGMNGRDPYSPDDNNPFGN